MKIYQIISDWWEDGEMSFTTKKEALEEFSAIEDMPAVLLAVTVSSTLKGRALICAIANRRGYAEEQEEIATK